MNKAAALDFVTAKVKEVDQLRRLKPVAEAHDLNGICELFLEYHPVMESTRRRLRSELRQLCLKFGEMHPNQIQPLALARWRSALAPGSQHSLFRAARQVMTWAVANDLALRNPALAVKNPRRARDERAPILTFSDWGEVEAVAAELHPYYAALPEFGVGTGLRPQEWIALHRSDLDFEQRLVHVRRRISAGVVVEGGKTRGSVRAVPLRDRVVRALKRASPTEESLILFPNVDGGYIDLDEFRLHVWTPALKSAGLATRPPKVMRHTFATWAIEAGVPALPLAKVMGTSLRQLEDTYYHLLNRNRDRIRGEFDAYDAAES